MCYSLNNISKIIVAILCILCLSVSIAICGIAEPDNESIDSAVSSEVDSSSLESYESEMSSAEEESSSEIVSKISSSDDVKISKPESTSKVVSTTSIEEPAAAPDETEQKNNDEHIGSTSKTSSQERVKKSVNSGDSEAESVDEDESKNKKGESAITTIARIFIFVPILLGLLCIFFLIRFNLLSSKARKEFPEDGQVSLSSFATKNKKDTKKGNGKH